MMRLGIALIGCAFLFFGCSASRQSIFVISADDRVLYERLLSEPDSVQFFTSFDLTRLAYREKLPKAFSSLLVFIHGTAAQSKLYLPLVDTLLRYGIAAACLDLRGHGLSEGERGDAKNSTALARDIKLFLDTLRAKHPDKKIILGGHSLGAAVCLKFIDFFRELPSLYRPPDALILMSGGFAPAPDCAPSEVEEKKKIKGAFANIDALKSLLFIPDIFLDVHFKSVEILLPNDSLVSKAVSQNLLTVKYAPSFFLAAFPFDIERTYSQIAFPTLCLVGRNDELLKMCDAKFALKKIRAEKKSLVVLEANHIDVIWRSAPNIAKWIKNLELERMDKRDD
jgi:alpha-beta hydrolase superfamily lysophospholipase